MSSLKFGTSGLRGLVSDLTEEVCFAYAKAFLEHMASAGQLPPAAMVLVGQDLRDSSPRIARACMAAIESCGMTIENCGALLTPGLALRAMHLKAPAIMVTGSHIPADRNGLKFYRPDGEIDKSDEVEITRRVAVAGVMESASIEVPVQKTALDAYLKRCAAILPEDALKAKRVGVYQHSSVARDVMVDVAQGYGADVIALAHSDVFVPVDTEALSPEDLAFAKAEVAKHGLDALISTDGDADRPMLFDENGQFVRGDLLGILTAKFLGADAVVTPVTSSSAIEESGLFKSVIRTKVGSPFVIAGMEAAKAQGAACVVGFEANGGVLLGSDVQVEGRTLYALPTRDSMLPMLAVLGLAIQSGKTVSSLVEELPARFAKSGRIEHVGPEKSGPFLEKLLDGPFQAAYFAGKNAISGVDRVDGVRFVFENGHTLHYRASGNAPELRCYAETGDADQSATLLDWGLALAARSL
ncbi:MAG: phosphomannomutase [Rhizobiaceae bacterium]